MTSYQFRFTNSEEWQSAELRDLSAARAHALSLASHRMETEPGHFWDGRSVGISVGVDRDDPIFTIFIAVLHGGLKGLH